MSTAAIVAIFLQSAGYVCNLVLLKWFLVDADK